MHPRFLPSVIAPVLFVALLSTAGTGASDELPARPAAHRAGIALEQRCIADGTVLSVQRAEKGVQKFVMHIESVRPAAGYPDAGKGYAGKDQEILSNGPLPPVVSVNAKLSIVLRMTGDEWQQKLFLVEVMDHGANK